MARASTFTSYINAELPTDLDGKWRKYEQLATSTFSNIERKAAEASRAVAGLSGGRGAGGIGLSGGGAARQARQMREVDKVNRSIAKSSRDVAGGLDRQNKAMSRTARESGRVARGLSAVSTSLNIVQGPLGPLAGRVSALSNAISDLTGFRLGLAGVASSLFVLGSVGNQYAQLEGRLKGAFVEQTRVNEAMSDVERIARNARAALDPIAETYVKLSKAGEQYNITQKESARLTETLAKAAALSGGSRQSQEAGITQFGQAFASGTLSGDELKSIRENTFVLAQAIANGMGVAVGELKELGAAGELTAERLAEALAVSAFEIDARFAAMPKTVSQGITELKNSFTLMVGSFDQAVGFSSNLAQAMSALAGAIRPLAAAAIGLGAAFAAVKAGKLTSDVAGLVTGFSKATNQTRAFAQARKVQAAEQQAFIQRSVEGLNREQVEIKETIALRQREANLAANNLRRVRGDPTAGMAAVKAALKEQVAAQQSLNAARRSGVATADALAASERRLEAATTRLNRATLVAKGRTGAFQTAVRNLIGAINPLGIAIGIATTALIIMATNASSTERILESVGDEATTTAKKMLGLAEANYKTADSFIAIARAQAKKNTAEKRAQLNENTEELADRLDTAARRIVGPGRDRAETVSRLQNLAKGIRNGTADIGDSLEFLERTSKKYERQLGGDAISNFFFGETDYNSFVDNAVANVAAAEELRQAKKDEAELNDEIEALEQRIAAAKKRGGQSAPVSTAGLRTEAAAESINSSTRRLEAATRRRNEAFRALDEEFGVSGGKVAANRAEEYKARAAEITEAYDMERQAIRQTAATRTAGARENNAAARQEIKDNRELAKSRLQLGLLDLEQRKPSLTMEQYYQERIKLLETYDAEIEAADATAEHVSAAIGQMIRDTREMSKAAEALAEKRRDIIGGWDDAPKALTRARDQIEDLQRMVGKFIQTAPGQFELYTAEQAASDAEHIMEGVMRPLQQAAEAAQRFREVSDLRLSGFDLAADALERALDLQDDIGHLTREQFDDIVAQTEEQQRINGLLAQRERLMGPILDSVSQTRDAFEDMLVDLPEQGTDAIGGFLKNVQMQMRRIYARQITEALFGGAEQRMKELLGTSSGGVDAAYEYLAKHARATAGEFEGVGDSSDIAASALDRLADAADRAAAGIGADGTAQNSIADIINSGGASPAEIERYIKGIGGAIPGVDPDGTIVVQPAPGSSDQRAAGASGSAARGNTGLRALGDTFGDALNKTFGTTFFRGLGDVFGGAGNGMAASGFAGMLGIKQSNTGAAIGGAIGSFLPIPGGDIIGGLIGGTIGGLFKKSRRSSANLTGPGDYTITGNGKSDLRDTAGGLADQVLSQLNDIAEAVGGTIGSFAVSIGQSGDSYHVDTTGRGRLKKSQGGYDFDQDSQAAIAFAVADAVADGAIQGISEASKRILREGKDLQKAIEKAVAIESIPKRLKAIKDPVGFAIDELNREFAQLISYLKEGGATAEQFSQAQELYDLERAQAIEEASRNAVSAIEQFMEDMISSSSSPLNKRTVYDNAQSTLAELADRVNRGEAVDQNALVSAAGNFQEASRNLFGSSQAFFDDFNMLFSLLGAARDNISDTTLDENGQPNVAPSPFDSDPSVRALIDQFRGLDTAIGDQTGALTDVLRDIRDGVWNLGGSGGNGGIPNLPGFGGGGSGGSRGGYAPGADAYLV